MDESENKPSPILTVREGISILTSEIQGSTINLYQVLESGVEPDHAHCGDILSLIPKNHLNRTLYNPHEYKDYFLDKYQIRGQTILVDPLRTSFKDEITIYRGSNQWQPRSIVQAFSWVDFPFPFLANNAPQQIYINTTRSSKGTNLYTVDVALGVEFIVDAEGNVTEGEPYPRTEKKLLDMLKWGESWIGKWTISRKGEDLLFALLAARVGFIRQLRGQTPMFYLANEG